MKQLHVVDSELVVTIVSFDMALTVSDNFADHYAFNTVVGLLTT